MQSNVPACQRQLHQTLEKRLTGPGTDAHLWLCRSAGEVFNVILFCSTSTLTPDIDLPNAEDTFANIRKCRHCASHRKGCQTPSSSLMPVIAFLLLRIYWLKTVMRNAALVLQISPAKARVLEDRSRMRITSVCCNSSSKQRCSMLSL